MKRTGLILLLIAMMPAIFYTAYEFSSLSQTEQVMKNIYDQQMNNILFNINQATWETTSNWAEDFRKYFSRHIIVDEDSVRKILYSKPAIDCIFLSDSIGENIQYFSARDTALFIKSNFDIFTKLIQDQKTDIERMVYRKKIGYDKPVSIILHDFSPPRIIILYPYINQQKAVLLLGICINTREFMETLPITLEDTPQDEIEIGVFDEKTGEIIERTGEITLKTAASLKGIWLFPNYQIGVKMAGVDLNMEVKRRFRSRLKWTLLLNTLLIVMILFLMKNIRNEMDFARIKSDFVSNVSHELRTPLALIRMYAETLSLNRVKNDEKRHEYYTIITKESERLSHLVNNILDFSKMESGKKSFNMEKADLNTIVRKVLDMYIFHLEQKGFEYEINLSEKALPIKGEEQGISEAIINLIDNAMKYSPEDKEVKITTGRSDNFCWVEIADKGQGIASAHQTQIFDKFFRVSTGLVHDTKGSGLGLALVDYTLKAHGGNISLKSKIGKGSEFRLNFPIIAEKA